MAESRIILAFLAIAILLGGCGREKPKPVANQIVEVESAAAPLSDLQKLVSSEEIILELGSRLKPKTTKGKELTKLVIEQLGSAATPFTVVVTPENDVVHVYSGLPTVSDLHKLIQQNGKKAER